MCRSPQGFVHASPTVPSMFCPSDLDGLWDRRKRCCFMRCCFWDFFETTHSLSSSHLAFIPRVSWMFSWCIHTVVLIVWKKSHFILWERSIFLMIHNLSIVFYVFPMHDITFSRCDVVAQLWEMIYQFQRLAT